MSVWTAMGDGRRTGWTVSSFLVADGEPGEVVGLIDEESDLAEALTDPQADATFVVNLLTWEQRHLADVFAGLAPAPGGMFRQGEWTESAWGPVLQVSAGWLGARLAPAARDHAGWGLLVRGTVEHVHLPDRADVGHPLVHVGGRYRDLGEATPG